VATIRAAGRTVVDILNAWVEVNQEVWAESSRRDQGGRAAKVLADPIAAVPLSRLGVADVEQWHARMRRAGVGESAIRSRHSVLRAALAQAARWEWIATNPAGAARFRQPKRTPRDGMGIEAVRAAIGAARKIDPAAGAEVGYRVAQRAADRGVATAALKELCQLATSQYGLRMLKAATSDQNVASQRVLMKAGFVPAGPADPADLGGKQGSWYRRDLTAVDPAQRDVLRYR
jgi:RimJ/RimL family protein N-acetyltransferase